MPLHLLGKKSWNVYNADNIARVRRDEAAAAAAEAAEEQRMQEVDAARRLAILRGETPPPLPEPTRNDGESSGRTSRKRDRDEPRSLSSRKRKRRGEDDTDFEMRLARERVEVADAVSESRDTARMLSSRPKKSEDIVDKKGHIDLIGGIVPEPGRSEKNPEYEREAAKKRRELEDQYTMRFANAAGRDRLVAGAPWYAKQSAGQAAEGGREKTKEELDAETGLEAPTKDAWGNEDPRRKVREAARMNAGDPLALMKSGAKKVREMEKERRRDVEERERELKELRLEERRREKRRRKEHRRRESVDGNELGELDRLDVVDRRHDGRRREERRHRHRDEDNRRHGDEADRRHRDRHQHRHSPNRSHS